MSDNLLKVYRERWQAVEEIERQEHQSVSIEHRWRQINAIFEFARALELKLDDPDILDDAVIKRWAQLKGLL